MEEKVGSQYMKIVGKRSRCPCNEVSQEPGGEGKCGGEGDSESKNTK